MSDRKYASDYRLETHITTDGRQERHRVYCGKRFSFVLNAKTIRYSAFRYLAACALALILMLPMLFNNTRLGHTFYIVFPMAFALLPLYQLMAIGVRILRITSSMTRQQRDQTEGRLGTAALWLALLTALSCFGCLVYSVQNQVNAGDVLCGVSMGGASVVSLWLFRQRSKFKTAEISE